MAKARRSTRYNHLNRDAGLRARRSIPMTVGISGGAHESNGHAASFAANGFAHDLNKAIGCRDGLPSRPKSCLAGFRQADTARMALKERRAEFLLELAHRQRQRRLADVKRLSGP